MYSRFKKYLITALLVGVGLSVLPSYVWAYKLSGASAAPTVLLGDTIVVNHAAYEVMLPYSHVILFRGGSPQREELVQAEPPKHVGLGVKRVIGLPGETIELRENRVIIGGRQLSIQPLNPSDFTCVPRAARGMGSTVVMEDGHWAAYTPGAGKYRNFSPIRLGPGEYYVMGDNRDNSLDSRAFGPISSERILGKVIAVCHTGPRLAMNIAKR
jgi:signal peptidase I